MSDSPPATKCTDSQARDAELARLRAENAEQAAQIAQLLVRIQVLEARLVKDSHNSSKLPSSDPPFKKPPPNFHESSQMSTLLHILFLSNHKYLPELRGGMEINTHQLCLQLSQRGVRVSVACSLNGGLSRIGLWTKLNRILFRKNITKDYFLSYPVYRAFGMADYVKEIVKLVNPDIVVVQGGHEYVKIMRSLAESRVPVVSYLHTPDPLPRNTGDLEPEVQSFIANSEFTARSHDDKQFSMILPPIIMKEDYRTTSRGKYIVFINPAKHKGLDIVLKLAWHRRNEQFLFVRNKRSWSSSQYGGTGHIPSNVKLIGPVDNMKKVYSKARLIVAPSQCDETWGRIATEAHCSGIPVLASNRGGLLESVGTGGICLDHDAPIEKWLDALDHMLSDANYDDYRNRAFEYARRDQVDPESIVQRFLLHITEQARLGSLESRIL